MRIGEPGHWIDSVGGPPPRRAALPGSIDVDVAIVGGGYTGLWTAFYLKRADPSMRIAVLEAAFCGAGASGRNGGWVSGFFSGPRRVYERRGGRDAVVRMQRAMFATVDEVGRVLEQEGIDADFVKDGHVAVAIGAAQEQRLRHNVDYQRGWGFDEHDIAFLPPEELAQRIAIAGSRGGTWTPHVARAHPAKLVFGLAAAVERLGVQIFEDTPVERIEPGAAIGAAGVARAEWIVRATEGYTARLAGLRRALVPMNSSMIVTEPLPDAAWQQIGWRGAEVVSDAAHVYVYLQRSADGRIAIGGRGHPYRFGSATDRVGEIPRSTVDQLTRTLHGMFPATRRVELAHGWSGVLGVPRDWCVSVNADPVARVAWGGGYVGEGVAMANFAGRTLADLIRGVDSELTGLPWVGRSPNSWEPEPLRWPAIQSVYAAYRLADRIERRTARPSRLGALVDKLSGRH